MKKETKSVRFRTGYSIGCCTSEVRNKISATVPGLALTNSEHLKKVKLGLPENAVKVIFDPENTYPDIRGKDLVEQREMLMDARRLVQELKAKKKKFDDDQAIVDKEKREAEQAAADRRVVEILEKEKLKGGAYAKA